LTRDEEKVIELELVLAGYVGQSVDIHYDDPLYIPSSPLWNETKTFPEGSTEIICNQRLVLETGETWVCTRIPNHQGLHIGHTAALQRLNRTIGRIWR
jgi:hypothetical protein